MTLFSELAIQRSPLVVVGDLHMPCPFAFSNQPFASSPLFFHPQSLATELGLPSVAAPVC
jgi:hypothetical protein